MRYLSVRFALLMQDDYDGRYLQEAGHLFTVNGKPVKPIRKPEGYYVFTNLDGDMFDVNIVSSRYCEKRVVVNAAELPAENPVVRLRMCRSPRSGFTDCEYLSGVYLPGKEIYALQEETPPLRLNKVLERDEKCVLTLQSYTVRLLRELRFVVGTGQQREPVFFGDRLPDGSYTLCSPLKNKHKPGAPILRGYWAECDGNGRYAIPLPKGAQGQITKVEAFDREVGKWDSL